MSLEKELTAFMEKMDNPVAIDNGDGTSDIQEESGESVEGVSNETLEEFLTHSYYGEKIAHDTMRYKRKFEVDDNNILRVY